MKLFIIKNNFKFNKRMIFHIKKRKEIPLLIFDRFLTMHLKIKFLLFKIYLVKKYFNLKFIFLNFFFNV